MKKNEKIGFLGKNSPSTKSILSKVERAQDEERQETKFRIQEPLSLTIYD